MSKTQKYKGLRKILCESAITESKSIDLILEVSAENNWLIHKSIELIRRGDLKDAITLLGLCRLGPQNVKSKRKAGSKDPASYLRVSNLEGVGSEGDAR